MWYSRLSWRCRSPYSYGFSYDNPAGRDGEPPLTAALPRRTIEAPIAVGVAAVFGLRAG